MNNKTTKKQDAFHWGQGGLRSWDKLAVTESPLDWTGVRIGIEQESNQKNKEDTDENVDRKTEERVSD